MKTKTGPAAAAVRDTTSPERQEGLNNNYDANNNSVDDDGIDDEYEREMDAKVRQIAKEETVLDKNQNIPSGIPTIRKK